MARRRPPNSCVDGRRRTIPDATLVVSDSLGHGHTGDRLPDRTAMYTWLIHGGAVTRRSPDLLSLLHRSAFCSV